MSERLSVWRLVRLAVCAGVLAVSVPATAQTTADELARRHFESGAAYLEQAEYESALREFDKAHELSKRPEILINIATVHERLGNAAGAVASLEAYLSAAPEGEHAETIRIRLENLKKRLAEQQPVEEAPPAGPPPETVPIAPVAPPQPPPPAAEPESRPSRLPAYVLLGIAGVTGVGAILTGVLAKGEYDDADERCAPRCTDDDLSTGRTLALTSTVLTGAAVVSAGIGAVLFFGSGSGEEQARSGAPRVTAVATGRAAFASARWGF